MCMHITKRMNEIEIGTVYKNDHDSLYDEESIQFFWCEMKIDFLDLMTMRLVVFFSTCNLSHMILSFRCFFILTRFVHCSHNACNTIVHFWKAMIQLTLLLWPSTHAFIWMNKTKRKRRRRRVRWWRWWWWWWWWYINEWDDCKWYMIWT